MIYPLKSAAAISVDCVELDDFGLKIGVLRMVGQVVSFITSPVHVPVRRVFTEDSPEDGVEACIYAWTVTDAETSTATE